jgi:hypothetical protein
MTTELQSRRYVDLTNDRKVFQIAKKFTQISITRSFNIYPNWDFWYENIPSGNPGLPDAF